ncbi:radial spoke head 10 homolog B [Chanos chanos]|uniref:Radial spoke head 10 homolog B n=1 Tax=Chanos chanos TaxID=29144 RepID=A0A6J2VGK6_CHACN|nr:radial spoke head 10 homolog B-like [Chanos chanos]
MAKGDKKKKNDKDTPEVPSNKMLESSSASSIGSEQVVEHESLRATDSPSASFVSQPPVVTPCSDKIVETHVLTSIVVERYEGDKRGDLFHGEGVAHFQDGHVYKGTFSDGLMHGRGLYIWSDGLKYEGDFASNVPIGHGTYTWKDGSCYVGEVCNAIRHGVGTFKSAKTSATYRGQWYNGKRHGKGIIYYNRELTSWYEGDWTNNCRDGWGVRHYPSGNIYEGQWKNNVRHGEGTMRWFQLGQQYSGHWENGIQHGLGKHTWFLKRVPGSQYPLRNEYVGEFLQGFRHGRGKFLYASGAVYTGGWKRNKKHGQGKFVFKNGRIFEGEFVDDRMAEFPGFSIYGSRSPDLSGIRTHSPPLNESSSLLGPDLALNIEPILTGLPEAQRDSELKQLEFAVLRHVAELRSIYSAYSSLGHETSPDNTFLLTRLQFWRLLKDCSVHQHGITMAQMDRLISGDMPSEEVHSPFTTMLLREYISSIIVLAYNIYHKDIKKESPNFTLETCFSKLMKQNILPGAKNIKGPLFSHPVHAVVGMIYVERSWEIYQAFCKVNPNRTMTVRHFIWMLKGLCLYDSQLTTETVLRILSADNPAIYNATHSNLDLEMTFLEFFEALLGCAEVKGNQEVEMSTQSLPDQTVRSSKGDEMKDNSERVSSSHLVATSTSESEKRDLNPEPYIKEHEPTADTKTAHQHFASIEPVKQVNPDTELECWIHGTHEFFTKTFFPAYEHSLQLDKEVQEERLRQSTRYRIALAKAKEYARLREQWEAEEEERRKEEEEEDETEKSEVINEPNLPSPAVTTPVASTVSMAAPKQSPTSSRKKKK